VDLAIDRMNEFTPFQRITRSIRGCTGKSNP
jgi:hypothetical protein